MSAHPLPADIPPTRAAVEALLSTLEPDEPLPAWARFPQSETQFCASVLAHSGMQGCPVVTPVYDENDVLVHFRGIGLRNKGGAA